MSSELMKQRINKAQMEIDLIKEEVLGSRYRQKYHFMAEAGWINDPNGLIYYKGQYHFFYQYNPYDAYWGAMHWGHAVSDDMLHFTYLPVALAPSESYDDDENGGCFSGSAIEYDGKLWLMYTGRAKLDGEYHQTQCVAWSDDGITFTKYENNPVVTAPQGYEADNFRDPKVWKHGEYFYMVCGAKKDNLAKALIYRSENMLDWEFLNVLAESRGELGYMWECPDFFEIGDKHVLMFSPMGLNECTSVYLVGDMNYETGKFIYSTTGRIDWGLDYYAPQSFNDADGRRIIVGWANSWDWMPWFKDWGPSFKDKWCGFFNLPREVVLTEDNRLKFIPIKELESLRCNETKEKNITVLKDRYLLKTDSISCEIKLSVNLLKTTAQQINLLLRSDGENGAHICIDFKRQEMSFSRDGADGWSNGTSRSPLIMADKEHLDIHIFIDQSSIEFYTDDYMTNHCLNVFAPCKNNRNYIFAAEGKAEFNFIECWEIKKATD